MNLEEAIEVLKGLIEPQSYTLGGYDKEALRTVLKALDERYNKGYQDGFKQAKFDCEMDKLQKEMSAHEFLRIRDIECDKYANCSDECKFNRRGNCVALSQIAVTIAEELKEVE